MFRTVTPSHPAYPRAVRASAWYDLVVTAGFATPWTYTLVNGALSRLGEAIGAGALPALDPIETLYANLMGSVVVVWALLRLVRPLPVHGLYDGLARTLFALWQAYALAHGAPYWLWPFLVAEVAFGVVQLVPWRLVRGAVSVPPSAGS
ncbi:hypothetical protein [Streptomyces sp. NBC_00523]|uniref:hypothetical protein n=1 Tax=unclassified Streptomyces TaxID=2593676 RepID=UPI002E8079ED|nr:hypothetical protein [Streptomyces sp. NBC_00523]WUD02817.1 hypothetical protein OHS17_25650 [Streptomyces sp. NBC_00523]